MAAGGSPAWWQDRQHPTLPAFPSRGGEADRRAQSGARRERRGTPCPTAAIVFAVLVFLVKLAGGGLASRWPRTVPMLSAPHGGVLLSAVFLHLLPEANREAAAMRTCRQRP